jgi:hypothetical protein
VSGDGGDRDEFEVWVNRQPTRPGHFGYRTAWLKDGPQVAKTVTYAEFGDPTSGEVKNRELRFRTSPRRAGQWDFDTPNTTWACQNDELDKLLAFLQSEVGTGHYRLVDSDSPQAALVDLLSSGDVDVDTLVAALVAGGNAAELGLALARSAGGLVAAGTAVLEQRRALIARLRAMAADPKTTETNMQHVMGDSYWLFGGRYVGIADRRNLVPLDQHDVPLVGADGTLHIVELKGPSVPRLVRRHRNHHIVGNEVHEATSQATNYLANLDKHGAALTTMYRDNFGLEYDMHRVFATVVIGHPAHVDGVTARQVEQTLRTYNSHLSRVEVMTWAMLLDAAERALNFEQETVDGEPGPPPAEPDPWATPSTPGDADPWSGTATSAWDDDEPPF